MGAASQAERTTRSLKPGMRLFVRRPWSTALDCGRKGLFLCLYLILPATATVYSQDLEAYREAIRSGDTENKREALFQIRNFRSEEASRIAVPALRDSDEIVRATAASSVVFLPPNEAATAILPLLKDKAEFVRKEAAFALGEAGSAVATGALVATMQRDKDPEVKTAAAAALGKLGDRTAIGPLTDALQKRPVPEEEFLRRSAARSVGQIAQIIQTGARRVVTPRNFLPDDIKKAEQPVHTDLAAAELAFRAAADVLASVLQNRSETDDTRREAAFSLGAIGDVRALQLLRRFLNSEDRYLAEICREAITKIETRAGPGT